MVSKNNQWQHLQATAQRVPHYGLRKLSIGVASVLLSTTLYAGVSAQADALNQPTNATTAAAPASAQADSNSNYQLNAVKQPAVAATMVAPTSSRVPSTENTSKISAAQPRSGAALSAVSVASNDSAVSASQNQMGVTNSVEKQAGSARSSSNVLNRSLVRSRLNLAVQPAIRATNVEQQTQVVSGQWTIHYRDATTQKELMPSTTINLKYQRQIEGYGINKKFGDWQVVPNSFGYQGTKVTLAQDSLDPIKSYDDYTFSPETARDSKEKELIGHNVDGFEFTLNSPEIKNYHPDYYLIRLTHYLVNDDEQADKLVDDLYVNYSPATTDTMEFAIPYNITGSVLLSTAGSEELVPTNQRDTSKLTILKSGKLTGTVKYTNNDLDSYFSDAKIDDSAYRELINGMFFGNQLLDWYVYKGIDTSSSIKFRDWLSKNGFDGFYISYEASKNYTERLEGESAKYPFKYISLSENETPVATGDKALQSIAAGYPTKAELEKIISSTAAVGGDYEDFDRKSISQPLVELIKSIEVNVVPYKKQTRQVTRQINLHLPTGLKQINQVATLSRGQIYGYAFSYDELVAHENDMQYWKNKDTDTPWTTAQWTAYDVPVVTGYKANVANISAEQVTDQTKNKVVDVYYTSTTKSVIVKYVDDEASGAQVGTTQTLKGTTGSKVATNIKAPTNYVLSGTYPAEYTFTDAANQQLVVHLKHAKQSVNDQKTVVRTVNYTDPKTSQPKLVERQTVTLQRTGAKDLVTNSTNWNAWSTAQFKAVGAPSIAGYHVTNGNVASALTVTDQSKDATVTFTYTANAQTTQVKYVDKDNPNNILHTTTVSGKTDQTVSVPSEVPAGWQLVSGQQVPTRITFTATGYPDTTVKIEHKRITIAPDHPKTTTDKLPDNPTKSYPAGVGQNDLNKTITRTIQVVDPHTQHVATTPQSVHLTRTADVDEVSGAVTYGRWTTGEWPTFDTPNVAGYTPTQANVAKTTVTDTTKDQTVKITYNANTQTTHVKYVDKDNSNNVIHTTNVSGKTDQTVSVSSEVPAGWQLVSGQQVPIRIIFTATGYPDTVVKIEHKHTVVSPDHPKTTIDKLPDNPMKSYPSGVGQNDLNKTITRTIQVVDPHTQKVTTTPQSVHLTRTADVDEVSGAVTYGRWTTGEWPGFNTPNVAGYTPTQASAAKTTVTDTTKDQTVKITYNANPQTTHVKYVDKDNSNNVIHTTNVSGKTDQTVNVSSEVPAGWQLVSGQQVPPRITFTATGYPDMIAKIEHKHVTVTPDQPKTTTDKLPDNPTKSYPAGVGQNDLNKTIMRTIQVVDPHTQKVATTPQTVHLTRTANVDEVSGAVTYGGWTTGEWPVFNTPNVAGYTPTQANVAKTAVTDTTKDQTVKITYAANPQSTTVNYVDSGNQVIHSTAIKGVTDQTVSVPNEVPTGWKLSNGSTVPTNLTFGPTGHPVVTVHIEHQHVTVTPAQPKTPSDKLPNNPTKSYPAGVGQNDLNKTLTRTIQVVDPHTQKVTATTQPVHLTRTANVDEVDGTVTYGKWTTGEWPTFNVPGVAGYTPSQASINQTTVTDTTKDQTIKITYTANAQTTQVNYVDQSGKVVHSTLIKGVTDQTVTVPNEVPANWQLVSRQTVPGQLTFGPGGHPAVTVKIEHQVKTVQEQKTITRTINYVAANGTPLKPATVQRLSFTRTGVQDLVTKAITWNSTPNQSFAAVDNLDILGYKPDITTVPAVTVNWDTQDSILDVHYQIAKSTVTVNLVDAQGHVIATTPVTGQVGSTVVFTLSIPDGWVAYNADLPTRVVIGSRPAELDYLIAHRLVLVKATDNVKAGSIIPGTKTKTFSDKVNVDNLVTHAAYTVNVWADEAHTRKLATKTYHADFTRDAVVDAVTGEVYYYNWSEGGKHTFAGFTRQAGDGYQAVVAPAWMATPANPTKTLDLVAQPQQAAGTIRYQTMDGSVVFSQDFAGNKAVTLTAPKGYTLMTNVAAITPAMGQGQIYTVYVRPTATLYTAADQRPAGVESLRKTVTRTIHITEANGHVRTITQRVRFTRTATVKADGSIVYSAWRATGRAVWNKVFLPKRHGYHVVIDGQMGKMNVTGTMGDVMVNVQYVKD